MTDISAQKRGAEENFLQDLNPAVKLVCFLLLIVSVIAIDSIWGYLLELAFILSVIYLSQLTVKETTVICGRLWPMYIIVFLLNTCFFAPAFAFARFLIFSPSVLGALKGFFTVVQIVLICVISEIFVLTTEPMSLVCPLSVLFYPLKLLGISANRTAIIVSLSIEFFGKFSENFREISRLLRGRNTGETNRTALPGGFRRILVPTVCSSVNDARSKALLLEARGFPGKSFGMRLVEKPELSSDDFYASIVSVAVFALQLIVF